jgi:hypothetical protein
MAVTKIKPIRTTIEKSIAYIINADKTESCLYVSSENCIPETAAIEFQFILDKARAGGNTIGRHLIQSFAPDEVTPEQAHEIGRRLANEILGGQYAYVMATHLDRDHCDEACKKIAANNKSIVETIKKVNAQKSRTAKEIASLNTEIVEMDRIRSNFITTHGENFYNKHSRKGGAR